MKRYLAFLRGINNKRRTVLLPGFGFQVDPNEIETNVG